MLSTLLDLVDLRERLCTQGAPPHVLRELNVLVQNLMSVLRARGELCGCSADCLDPSYAPEDDETTEDEELNVG
jgi:hypothetical protein